MSLEQFHNDYEAAVERLNEDPDAGTQYVLFEIIGQIEALMEERGVTQAELAERLGVSRPRISALLSGQPNTSIKTLMRIAYALDAIIDVPFGRPKAVQERERKNACVWRPGRTTDQYLSFAATTNYEYLDDLKERHCALATVA